MNDFWEHLAIGDLKPDIRMQPFGIVLAKPCLGGDLVCNDLQVILITDLEWAAKRLIVKSQRNAAHCGDQTTFVKVINDDFTTEKSLQPIPTMTGTFGSTRRGSLPASM